MNLLRIAIAMVLVLTVSSCGTYFNQPFNQQKARSGEFSRSTKSLLDLPNVDVPVEVAIPEFDNDLLLLKTNDLNGYSVRIFTYTLSTDTVETVILEGELGAAGSIDITVNATKVLYTRIYREVKIPIIVNLKADYFYMTWQATQRSLLKRMLFRENWTNNAVFLHLKERLYGRDV